MNERPLRYCPSGRHTTNFIPGISERPGTRECVHRVIPTDETCSMRREPCSVRQMSQGSGR